MLLSPLNDIHLKFHFLHSFVLLHLFLSRILSLCFCLHEPYTKLWRWHEHSSQAGKCGCKAMQCPLGKSDWCDIQKKFFCIRLVMSVYRNSSFCQLSMFNMSVCSEYLSSLCLTGLQMRSGGACCFTRGMLLKMGLAHSKSCKVHSLFWANSQLFSVQAEPQLNRIMLLRDSPPSYSPHGNHMFP